MVKSLKIRCTVLEDFRHPAGEVNAPLKTKPVTLIEKRISAFSPEVSIVLRLDKSLQVAESSSECDQV